MSLPSATALAATVPYTKFATTVHYWVPTIASQAAPTLSELNAGKNLTFQIDAIDGFTYSAASIDLPRAGTSFTGNLPGRQTADSSTITFILSTAGPSVDIRSVLSVNQTGFVVFFNEGIVTGGYMDVWPVRIGSVPVPQDIEAAALCPVQFYIPQAPSTAVAIPTS